MVQLECLHSSRMNFQTVVFFLFVTTSSAILYPGEFKPDWDSLDQHKLPEWYDEAKFGIFIHWGVYSVQSITSEWMWKFWEKNINGVPEFMKKHYAPGFSYQQFAEQFKAMNYEPDKWVEIFKEAGAKYVVLTSKHHDGFTLWPSKYSFGWNAKDVGPHRDLVGELADSVRKNSDIVFGLYHSLMEWYNPMFMEDEENNFQTNNSHYVMMKMIPEMKELVTKYQPNILWSDGVGGASSEYYHSQEFLAWLYNESPVRHNVAVNDRWGQGTDGKHGDFYNFKDHYIVDELIDHKWESCGTIDKGSWGYRPANDLKMIRSTKELIGTFVNVVAMGGNFLLNIGPNMYGTIEPIFEERLKDVGAFLKVNGEAIYKTRPWIHQNETITPGIWYTSRNYSQYQNVYAIILNYPRSDAVELYKIKDFMRNDTEVRMLGFGGKIKTMEKSNNVIAYFPSMYDSFNINPNAWVFEFRNNNYRP